ncbi:transcriptional regulator, MarR family [Legionella santicrucis]|uniref:Transcriptional regulator, MarR family n=1 Tax=Legionella santicrucis TaxID=45074 RepID=A0A0W0YCV6_9GAMM|nr:MarR family transcriptional regulator [Legionella santicrucis]KTD54793.1 transcriptional regulator, MarR family [Legionella santicrucis]
MEKKNVSPLKSHIGYHMRVVSNEVSQAFAKKLSKYDVAVAEWVILREMYETKKSTSPSAVAEMVGLTRGAVSKLIERLLNKDLVTRTESSNDRRFQQIKLTSKAIQLVPSLADSADQNDESFFGVLSDNEKGTLIKILKKLSDHHKFNGNPIK